MDPCEEPLKPAEIRAIVAEKRPEDERIRAQARATWGLDPVVTELSPVCGRQAAWLGLKYRPTKAQATALDESGFAGIWPDGASHHPHLVLNVGRALAEYQICRLISDESRVLGRPPRVYDVGSNALRFRAALTLAGVSVESVHHGIPQQQFGDPQRLVNARGRFAHCTHLFEHCTCAPESDIIILQHSIYYVPPEALLARPVGTMVLFSVHDLPGGAGSFGAGEGAYYLRDDGLLEVKVKGNNAPYVHPPTGWIRRGVFENTYRILEFEFVGEFLFSKVYQGRVLQKAAPSPPAAPPFQIDDPSACSEAPEDYLARLDHRIRSYIETKALGPDTQASMGVLSVTPKRLYLRYGALFYDTGSPTPLAVPCDLIGILAARCAGVPRDGVLYRHLQEVGKKLLASGNMPPGRIATILAYVVPIAMFHSLEQEAAQLAAANQGFGALNKAYSEVLQGRGAARWRWWHYLVPKYWWAGCCSEEEHHRDEARSLINIRAGGYAGVPTRPVTLPPGTAFPPVYEPKTSALPAQARGHIVGQLEAARPPPPDSRMVLHLIATMPGIPTCVSNTLDELILGFCNRLNREPETVAKYNLWEEAWNTGKDNHRSVLSRFHHHRGSKILVTDDMRREWINRFPENLRRLYDAAWEDWRTHGVRPSDLVGRIMLKIEKSAMCLPGTVARLTPRCVISFKEKRQLITGPVDWHMAKRLRRKCSPSDLDNPFVWVNGPDVEHFGRWFDHQVQAIAKSGKDVWYEWGDNERFESKRRHGAYAYTKSLRMGAVDPSEKDYLWVQKRSAVVTGSGVRHPCTFKLYEVLCSGGTETSLDSAQRNGTQLVLVFGEPRTGTSALAFNGDDWLRISSEPLGADDFGRRLADLGSVSEYGNTREPSEIEFCQSVPYPVGGETVWGPKIGRVLARLPYSTTADKFDAVGVAKGMVPSCSHVPFLREYLDFIIAFRPDAQAVEFEHHVATRRIRAPEPDTWAFIAKRYALYPHDLTEFLRILRTATALGTIVHWERGLEIAAVDE